MIGVKSEKLLVDVALAFVLVISSAAAACSPSKARPFRFEVTRTQYLGAPLVRLKPVGRNVKTIFLPSREPADSIVAESLGSKVPGLAATCGSVRTEGRPTVRTRFDLDEGEIQPSWEAVEKPITKSRSHVPAGWYRIRVIFASDPQSGLWESVTSPFYLEKDAGFMTVAGKQ
jgi:hypothetical protein